MKMNIRNLMTGSLFGLSLGASAAPYLVPNGDFSLVGGENWTQAAGQGTTLITYEAAGGNSGGYGQIDNSIDGDWAVLVQEGGTGANPALGDGIPLTSLGLTAGETYVFSLDMIDLDAGATMAGLKMESWANGGALSNSGDQLFAVTSSWATYSFEYTINPGATALKFVPVMSGAQGVGVVGFDNVGGDDEAIAQPPVDPDLIENGDFEIANGASWGTVQGTPQFPTSGGNPNGHTILDGTSGFAVLYAFDNTEKTFASLGFAPGETLVIQLDMKAVSGSFSGGIRLEGPAGYVEELYPAVIGDGTTWETYTVEVVVPASPAQAKIGLRPGGSVMAFDNVGIGVSSSATNDLCIEIQEGTVVSWVPTSADNNYQLQGSNDGSNFDDIGPLNMGNTTTSLNVDTPYSSYRVQEYSPSLNELVGDGDFESGGIWGFNDFSEEVENGAEALSGDWFARLAVDNDGVAAGQAANLTQQTFGGVSGGDVLDFSLQAYIESVNGGSVFQYQVQWLGPGDTGVIGLVSGSIPSSPTGEWMEVTSPGLVAPPGTDSAFVLIQAVTGASPGDFCSMRVDDVSLAASSSTFFQNIAATPTTGLLLSWQTQDGFGYQLQSSPDLASGFTDLGTQQLGNGSMMTIGDSIAARKFYQVIESAPAQ